MRLRFLLASILLSGIAVMAGSLVPLVSYAQQSAGTGIVVQEPQDASVAHALADKITISWPWYLTRASGLVAGLVLIILMLSGIGFITGTTYRFLEPITAWASHRALGIILGIAVILHMVGLYFDTFVAFSLRDILLPFVSDYKPIQLFGVSVGSLYVALGVLSLYVLALIILSSLLWIDKKPKTWKFLHLMSYITIALVFVHGLFLGTDLSSGILRWMWVALGLFVLWGSVARLWRAKTV